MGISLVALSNTTALAVTINAPKPSGTAEHDLMVAFLFGNSGSGITIAAAPSGWTEVQNSPRVSGRTFVSYFRVAGSAEPDDYVWASTGVEAKRVVIVTYRGLRYATSPLDASAKADSLTTPSVTTTRRNAFIVRALMTYAAASATWPTSTEQVDAYDANYGHIAIADRIQTVPGAAGTEVVTPTPSGPEPRAHTIAFHNAAVARSSVSAII